MKWSRALYAVLILVVLAFLYGVFVLRADSRDAVEISKVAELANKGQIDTITVDQNQLIVKLNNGSEISSNKEPEIGVVETLRILGVSEENLSKIKVSVAPRSAWDGWLTVLGTLLPLILIGGFFFFILRQAQGAGNQALNFGKSRARTATRYSRNDVAHLIANKSMKAKHPLIFKIVIKNSMNLSVLIQTYAFSIDRRVVDQPYSISYVDQSHR
jgi:cell division protease FtsH